MQRPNIVKRIGNAEVFSRAPLVELTGEKQVLIENHHGVLGYSLEEIQIKVDYGKLVISGNELKIMEMNKEQLVIFGRIDQILISRR